MLCFAKVLVLERRQDLINPFENVVNLGVELAVKVLEILRELVRKLQLVVFDKLLHAVVVIV